MYGKKATAKFFAIICTLVAIFSFCSLNAFAADDAVFSAEILPGKEEYASGETIKFQTKFTNTTLTDAENVMLWVEVPENDGYLTGGVTEREYEKIDYAQTIEAGFSLNEDETVTKIGVAIASFSTLLSAVYIFFVRKYNRLSLIFVTVSLIFSTAFSGFPAGLSHLFAKRDEQYLGACNVVYDGQELEFRFYASYERMENAEKPEFAGVKQTEESFTAQSDIKPSDNGISGIVFGCDLQSENFSGGVFCIDVSKGRVLLLKSVNGRYFELAGKNVTLDAETPYKMSVSYDSGRLKCILHDNKLEAEPYPVFDVYEDFVINSVGVCASGTATHTGLSVSPCDLSYDGETYTNPVVKGIADPYILTYDGMYYLYGTANAGTGFKVWTSADLVNWEAGGFVAHKDNIMGDTGFWAPEVYHYKDRFYMFYTAQEYTYVAVADSPYGPFASAMDKSLFDFPAIDSSLFIDDDGKIYLYFSKMVYEGEFHQELWGCEMNSDLLSYKENTLTFFTTPTDWEGWVNEGPFMLKHNGYYYLTYTGQMYMYSDYGSSYAVSDSPLGKFEKFANNPILDADSYIKGTGHHSFAFSPDGSEMFIVYHCHDKDYDGMKGLVRHICIDRAKFVPTESGIDELKVYGPTVTSQPMPSGS